MGLDSCPDRYAIVLLVNGRIYENEVNDVLRLLHSMAPLPLISIPKRTSQEMDSHVAYVLLSGGATL